LFRALKAAGVTLLPVEQNVEWALNLADRDDLIFYRSAHFRIIQIALIIAAGLWSGLS
jgi:hypothetical protein